MPRTVLGAGIHGLKELTAEWKTNKQAFLPVAIRLST